MKSTQVKISFMVPCALFRFCSKWNYENRPAVVYLMKSSKMLGQTVCLINIPCHWVYIFPSAALKALCWREQKAESRTIIVLLRMSTFGVHEQFFFIIPSVVFVFFFLRSSWACSTFVGGGFITLQVGLKNTHPLVEGFSFLFIGHWLISVYCWPNDFI